MKFFHSLFLPLVIGLLLLTEQTYAQKGIELRISTVETQSIEINNFSDTSTINWRQVIVSENSAIPLGLIFHGQSDELFWQAGLQYVVINTERTATIFGDTTSQFGISSDFDAIVSSTNLRSRLSVQWKLNEGGKIDWRVGPFMDVFYRKLDYSPGRSDIFPAYERSYGLLVGPTIDFQWNFASRWALHAGIGASLFQFSNTFSRVENPVLTERQQELNNFALDIDFSLQPLQIGVLYRLGE